MRLIDADEVANCYERMMKILDEKNALPEQITEFAVAREYLQWASYVINNAPTVDAVERIEYEKMKDLAEQYKFEYECVLEAHKEVLNEVLPKRVEVVRCKDCKWYDNIGCALIIVDEEDRPKPDDYCSYGERKKNE